MERKKRKRSLVGGVGRGGGPAEGGRHRHDFAVPDPSSSEAGLKFSPLGFVEILPYPSHKVIVLLEQTAVLCSQGAPARPPGPEEALPAEGCSEDPSLQGSSHGPGPCPLSSVGRRRAEWGRELSRPLNLHGALDSRYDGSHLTHAGI